MTRAAIYARYSSDLQRDRSIEDQVEVCRQFAARDQLEVVDTFEDRARSGASIMGRDGLLSLMDAARDGKFSVVIVEALDRLSRDQEDLAGIYKRLSFAGIEIRAVHDGVADQVQVGIRGLVGALYLQDLAHKVRRGMSGVTRDGRHAGGRAYGYRPVLGKPGELRIEEDEAEIVRRIFTEYLAGKTPRAIAGGLNADGIPAPRGTRWAASTLNGNKARGHGILVNPLYAGEIVWNRVRMIKDPETGRRLSRVNPEVEWQRAQAPHLAIIDRDTFDAAQSLKEDRTHLVPARRKTPRHLLSGLLKCGCCGAGMSVKDKSAGRVRVQCSAAKESASCANRKSYYLDTIEPAVIDGLRDKLGHREAIALYLRTYNEEQRRLSADIINRRGRLESRFTKIESSLKRAINLAVEGVLSDDDAREQIGRLKVERADIEAELAQAGEAPKVVELHPAAVRAYLESIARLERTLSEGAAEGQQAAFQPIRDLVDSVTIHPNDNGPFTIEVTGHLQKLIGGDHFPHLIKLGGTVVAEARYRRTPQDVRPPFSFITMPRRAG